MTRSRLACLVACLVLSSCLCLGCAVAQSAAVEQRVNDLLARLTLEEKLKLVGGTGFGTQPVPRVGLPAMGMCDGPVGVRGGGEGTFGPATAFPSGIAMAATFDPGLVRRLGAAIGRELQNKGVGSQVILGPCVNIHRTPLGGRNAESFSEDPYLAARMAVAYVTGVQSTGAAACIKHYACNNQEHERGSINVRVDERALREIYLPAFEAAAREAGVWSVMNAYNKVNGPHCSANDYLLNTVLKNEWGWDGCVMTDWGAAHSTVGVALGGTDLEMPTGALMNPKRLQEAIDAGKVSTALIDEKVRRILRLVVRTGLLDGPPKPDNTVVNCQEHKDLVREAGARAIVLLKNDGGLLPLDPARLRSLALIGPNAAENRLSMGGSGYVSAAHSVSLQEALSARLGDRVTINYARGADMGDEALPPIPAEFLSAEGAGLHGEYYANLELKGQPVLTRTDAAVDFHWRGPVADKLGKDNFSARWTGKLTPRVSGEYSLGLAGDDGYRLYLDGQLVINNWEDHALEARTVKRQFEGGRAYELKIEYYQKTGDAAIVLGWRVPGASPEEDPQIKEAVAAAAKSDVAIVCLGLSASHESEGRDRTDLNLPGLQEPLVRAVAAANPRTIVVLTNGCHLLMGSWLPQVAAVLEAWYLGEQGGNSVADVLLGTVNPSGHLPDTLGKRREDYPDYGNYPGADGHVDYAESIFVGYRHFDKHGIEPQFPFGYGLSYTTFEYRDLKISPRQLRPEGRVRVTVQVTNTGARAGEDVVQLYVHDPRPRLPKAPRELKGFARVALQPGESAPVSFTLEARSLVYCDVAGKQWRADAGTYQVQIGASSRDLRLTGDLPLAQAWTRAVPAMGSWAAAPSEDYGKDLALGRPATASSVERADTGPECAVDGKGATRWSSQFSDPQWLQVDLGRTVAIGCVRLRWETAYGAAYSLSVSVDGEKWEQVYTASSGQGEDETITLRPVPARYVRLTGQRRGTDYGYSLYSFQVYAAK